MKKLHYDGPVVLVVMDGVGLSLKRSGNAVRQAHTEFLDHAMAHYLSIPLAASGEAVGILPGLMGNSEVGHNAIGSGQIIQQGVAHVETAFKTGDIWRSKAWRGAINFLTQPPRTAREAAAAYWRRQSDQKSLKPTLHFCGIFSDGGVHSDIKYLEQMIARAVSDGVKRIRIHAIFDGRDVGPQSEPRYIDRIEKFCKQFPDADICIASGGGRMVMTADRYGNDWGMVKLGYDAMVHGKAPYKFPSARQAITTLRRDFLGIQDQYLPAFVISDGSPVGKIVDGDAVIYYDFRADRAVEISEALTAKSFDKFNRGRAGLPNIYFAGLTEYDADRHIPKNVLVPTIKIEEPLNKFLGSRDLTDLAVSETVKFGHITYYFNGNSYKKAPGEKHIEIPSDVDTSMFRTRPWMKAAEITDAVLGNMHKFDFVRVNFPNGDMVGHFGELEPTIVAVEAIDLQLSRLAEKVDELGGMMIITADHGNAEELIDHAGDPKTSHTTNPVPCIFYDNTKNADRYRKNNLANPGIANLASTIALLLGQPDYPASWQKPLIKV